MFGSAVGGGVVFDSVRGGSASQRAWVGFEGVGDHLV